MCSFAVCAIVAVEDGSFAVALDMANSFHRRTTCSSTLGMLVSMFAPDMRPLLTDGMG